MQDFSPKVLSLLQEHFILSTGGVEQGKLLQLLKEVDIFWFRLGYKLNDKVLNDNIRCKFLVTPVTGIDHIDEELCIKLGIRIICLRGEEEFLKEVRATAEHTILLTMMLMRHGFSAVSETHNGHWRRDLYRGHELHNKKIGIIGYGRLGKIVADYFSAFGCEVGFYDIDKKEHPEYIRRFKSMMDCIKESDIISLHVPYNPETHRLINEHTFRHFTEKKWLVNTSRGGIIDESVLLDYLKNNKIAGAALDVLYGEPDIINNPLIIYAKTNRNLVITPHIGGSTYESFEKTESFIANKLFKFLDYQIRV